jgi:D-alanyl-D-alanine carboxypeptidase/D-alanyl-D-alanine-endopeptidase (penicillin-binding protein 4)
MPSQAISLVVWRAGAPVPELNLNGGVSRTPASLMKLVTTWSALTLLGPAYSWRTELRAQPPRAEAVGNLYIAGQGNPYWTLEDFENMLRTLRARGVRKVEGNLVLEQNHFPAAAGSLQDGQPWRAYNVVPDSLMLGFQSLTWALQTQQGRVLATPNFPMPGVVLNNQIKAVEGECPLDWKQRLEKRVEDDGEKTTITLSGGFSRACEGKTLAFSVLDQQRFMLGAFRQIWSELGGEFHGRVERGAIPDGLATLSRHDSPSLAQVLVAMNKESNNPMARTLFLDLGCQDHADCRPQDSSDRIKQSLIGAGINLPELVLENGSGLSRQEKISALGLARLLQSVNKTPWQPEFKASLPLYGLDGTLKSKGRDEPWVGRFRLKGGTLDGARGLAGYGISQAGEEYVVVLIANHEKAAQLEGVARAVMEWVYSQH